MSNNVDNFSNESFSVRNFIEKPTKEIANKLVLEAKNRGLILFWLLIEKRAVRITPPLTITDKEIEEGCNIILNILDTI